MSEASRATNNHLPPTPPEGTAISVLNPERAPAKDSEIISWLKVIRSIGPNFVQKTGPGLLSTQEFEALATLSRYDDGNIRQWLRNDRLKSQADHVRDSVASSHSFSTTSSVASRKFAKSTPRTSAYSLSSTRSSLLKNEVFVEERKKASSPDNYREPVETPDTTAASPPGDPGSGALDLACTTGLHRKARQTSLAAWKRHEREHLKVFPCVDKYTMLVVETTSGFRCILCDELQPGADHFAKHNLTVCKSRDEPLVFSRKNLLVEHLVKEHKVPKSICGRLAEAWFYEIIKSAFSCGFCVGVLFPTKEDQISHIEREHLKMGQSMQNWDYTKVMRNLLHHPQVIDAWNRILSKNPSVFEQFLWWPPSVLKDVRLELDLNKETAEKFVESAFQHAKMDYVDEIRDDTEKPPGSSALAPLPEHPPVTSEVRRVSETSPTAKTSTEDLWPAMAGSRDPWDPMLTDYPSTSTQRIQQWQQDSTPYSDFAYNYGTANSLQYNPTDAGTGHGDEVFDTGRNQPVWRSSDAEYRVTRGPNPILVPVKRKVSTNKEKVEDTHRRPCYDLI